MNFTSPVEAESSDGRDALCIFHAAQGLHKVLKLELKKKRKTSKETASLADKERIIAGTWLNFKVN